MMTNSPAAPVPSTRPRCAICQKIRKLVGWSSLEKWLEDPDICFGCAKGLKDGGTQCGGNLV